MGITSIPVMTATGSGIVTTTHVATGSWANAQVSLIGRGQSLFSCGGTLYAVGLKLDMGTSVIQAIHGTTRDVLAYAYGNRESACFDGELWSWSTLGPEVLRFAGGVQLPSVQAAADSHGRAEAHPFRVGGKTYASAVDFSASLSPNAKLIDERMGTSYFVDYGRIWSIAGNVATVVATMPSFTMHAPVFDGQRYVMQIETSPQTLVAFDPNTNTVVPVSNDIPTIYGLTGGPGHVAYCKAGGQALMNAAPGQAPQVVATLPPMPSPASFLPPCKDVVALLGDTAVVRNGLGALSTWALPPAP